MRRILNLNQPGMLFVKLIGLFMVMIPAVVYAIMLVFRLSGIARAFLLRAIKISFVVGGLIFVVFLVLIIVEQIQDHIVDMNYQKQRDQKILLSNGKYECQYCGNQKVKKNDKICSVCGKEFAEASRK